MASTHPPNDNVRFLISNYSQRGFETFTNTSATYVLPTVRGELNPKEIVKTIVELAGKNRNLPKISVELGLTISDSLGKQSMFIADRNTMIFQSLNFTYNEELRLFRSNLKDKAVKSAAELFRNSDDIFSKVSLIVIRLTAIK